VAGRPAKSWMRLFMATHEWRPGRPAYYTRLEWPSGGSANDQDMATVEVMRILRDEANKIEIERATRA